MNTTAVLALIILLATFNKYLLKFFCGWQFSVYTSEQNKDSSHCRIFQWKELRKENTGNKTLSDNIIITYYVTAAKKKTI